MRRCGLLTLFVAISLPIYRTSCSHLGAPGPTVSSHKRKSGCIKVNRCKCIMMDGSGIINLAALEDAEGFLGRQMPVRSERTPPSAGEATGGSSEVLLSFSPCHPFTVPEDDGITACSDVAACLIVRLYDSDLVSLSKYLNYGRHRDNQFHYNSTLKTLTVAYFVMARSQPITEVHYHCSPNRSLSSVVSFEAKVPLQVWVESPCACPNACTLEDVGPGTILVILLSISAAAYFILGACALRPFRTSRTGVQISPEDSVWCMPCYHFTDREPTTRRRRHYSLREDTL